MMIETETALAEEIIEPEIEIIDAHHHFYDPGLHHGLHQSFLVPDLLSAAGSGHHVVGSVFVECSWRWDRGKGPLWASLPEVEAVVAADREARRAEFFRGVAAVGHVDLRQGAAVGEVLDVMRDRAGPVLVGIRHGTVFDDAPEAPKSRTCDRPGLMQDVVWRDGLREIGRRGLVFDAMVLHPQLPELTDLARSLPDVCIVVNHLGGPVTFGHYGREQEEVIKRWRADMTVLARCQNASLKLGGIGNPFMARGEPAPYESRSSEWIDRVWGDDIRWLIELFGTERCMFESNFPVDRAVASYRALWNGFKRIVAGASDDEKKQLFSGTARRIYSLGI